MTEKDFLCFAAKLFEMPEESVSLDTAYNSIVQWDSIMHLRLVMEVEATCGISIPFEKISELRNLRAVFELINKK